MTVLSGNHQLKVGIYNKKASPTSSNLIFLHVIKVLRSKQKKGAKISKQCFSIKFIIRKFATCLTIVVEISVKMEITNLIVGRKKY